MGPAGLLHHAKHRDEGGGWSGGSEQSCEGVREEESCFPVPVGSLVAEGRSGKALYKGGPEPSPLAGLRRTLGQLLGLPSSSSPAAAESSGLAGAPADPFQTCSLCSANDGAFLRAVGLDLPNGAGLGYSSARRGAGSRTGAICPGSGQSVA